MKLKIDFYLVKVLKENLIYLGFFILLIVVYLLFSYSFVNRMVKADQNISKLRTEIADLKKQAELVTYKQEVLKEGIDFAKTNEIFTKLIPNEEDFFSVIAALEKISQETNFLIVNYSINLKSSTKDKLSLTVEGKGDDESFFNFLKNYRYSGGRLITIDKIDYRTTGFTEVKLIVNFYSGKANGLAKKTSKLSEDEKKMIKEIEEKITLDLKSEEATSSSYAVKSNPF